MSDPEMTTFGMYPNWGIEYCKAYAEQLRDKTRANRAVHAAECIEYLLSLVQKEWVGLTDEEYELMAEKRVTNYFFNTLDYAHDIEAKLKEKNASHL
jgi:hypothetical protein